MTRPRKKTTRRNKRNTRNPVEIHGRVIGDVSAQIENINAQERVDPHIRDT